MAENDNPGDGGITIVINIKLPNLRNSVEKLGKYVKPLRQTTGKMASLLGGTVFPLPTMMANQAINDYRLTRQITKKQAALIVGAAAFVVSALWMIHKGHGTTTASNETHNVTCVTDCASFANDSELPVVSEAHLPKANEMPSVAILVP